MLDPTAPSTAALRAMVLRCVPGFSDYCAIVNVAHGHPEYLLEQPTKLERPEWERTLRTPVFLPSAGGRAGDHVVLLHWWHDRRRPSLPDALTALTLADQALLHAISTPSPSRALHLLGVAS